MPMQLGPTIGIPAAVAISTILSWSAIASGSPVSAKPEVNMLTPATPFFAASATMRGATGRGTAQITRSISPGTSSSEVKLVYPRFSISAMSFGSTCTE